VKNYYSPRRMYVRWNNSYTRGFGARFRASDKDVEYIRADVHKAEVEALREELDRLVEMIGGNKDAPHLLQPDGQSTRVEC